MNAVAGKLTLASILLAGFAAPLRAQHSGSNAEDLPPHVREQLWPEQKLSPAEQELKERVIAMRDSVLPVQATVAQIERQQRGGGSSAVLTSGARRLAGDCARVERNATTMSVYAAGLTTSNARWGESSLRTFRNSIASLGKAMGACQAAMARETEGRTTDGERLAAAARNANNAVAAYRIAELGLLNTLKIKIDPRGSGKS